MIEQRIQRSLNKKAAKKSPFKPCAGCPSPAKCKAAGKCMKGKM